jgi:lipopolysaccharide/colanic/teichoic acid biosynthesis glycosyltransferase
MFKILFDFIVSLIGLGFSIPIFLFIMAWVKMDSPGGIFYRGVRVGKNGKLFKIYKFRSMVIDAENVGVTSTSIMDSRITSSGHFIRKWKLDEFAQLINVLKGDMSLVGPRPEVKEFVDMFNENEKKILKLKPGISDWASIWNSDEGRILEGALDADAVYKEVIRPIKLELQLYYVQNRSFLTDMKILFYTIYSVFIGSFIPKELSAYADFNSLREHAVEVIEKQKTQGEN